MAKQYVMTLTAANRVGILAAVSNAIAELGGDVQEVNVTVMQKFFTIILSADFPDHREANVIVDHIRGIGRPYGMEVCLKDPEAEQLQDDSDETREHYYVRIHGDDQPGSMRQIAVRLAQDSVDIADLYAARQDDATFEMSLDLSVPTRITETELHGIINELSRIDGLTATLENRDEFIASRVSHSLQSTVQKETE